MKKGDKVFVNVGVFTGSPLDWALRYCPWKVATILDGPNDSTQFYVKCENYSPMWVFAGYLSDQVKLKNVDDRRLWGR